jgi:hypothetical protein
MQGCWEHSYKSFCRCMFSFSWLWGNIREQVDWIIAGPHLTSPEAQVQFSRVTFLFFPLASSVQGSLHTRLPTLACFQLPSRTGRGISCPSGFPSGLLVVVGVVYFCVLCFASSLLFVFCYWLAGLHIFCMRESCARSVSCKCFLPQCPWSIMSFCVCVVQLTASCLPGQSTATWTMPPALFSFSYFSDRVLHFCTGPALDCDLPAMLPA